MKSRDIEAAIASGVKLALRPKASEHTAYPLISVTRASTRQWRAINTRLGSPIKISSSSIVTLASAEESCGTKRQAAINSIEARHQKRESAIEACRLIEAHAPSARVAADGRVSLSPEDATKLAGLLGAS